MRMKVKGFKGKEYIIEFFEFINMANNSRIIILSPIIKKKKPQTAAFIDWKLTSTMTNFQ